MLIAETGRSSKQWNALLDAASADAMDARELRDFLRSRYGLRDPWHAEIAAIYDQHCGRDPMNRKKNGRYRIAVRQPMSASPVLLFQAFIKPSGFQAWMGEESTEKLVVGHEFRIGRDILRVTDIFEFVDAGYVRLERHRDDGFAITHASFRGVTDAAAVEFAESNLPDPEARDASKAFWTMMLEHLSAS